MFKRSILFLTLALLAMVSSPVASAQSELETELLNTVVSEMNAARDELLANAQGSISDFTCSRSGKNIVIDMTFALPELNFNDLDQATKQQFLRSMEESFISGMLKGDNKGLSYFKAMGTKFVINIYDYYGHKISRTVDTKDY